MKKPVALALAAILSIAAPATTWAAPETAASSETMVVDGQNISVPVPSGLCRPTGEMKGIFDQLQKSLPEAKLLLVLMPCSGVMQGGGAHVLAFAEPTAMAGRNFDRQTVIASFGAVPDNTWSDMAGSKAMNDRTKGVIADIDKGGVLKDAKVDATLHPIGRDAFGFYLGGQLAVSANGANVIVPLAEGVTAVKGRVLLVLAYGVGEGDGPMRETIALAKSTVAAVVHANDP